MLKKILIPLILLCVLLPITVYADSKNISKTLSNKETYRYHVGLANGVYTVKSITCSSATGDGYTMKFSDGTNIYVSRSTYSRTFNKPVDWAYVDLINNSNSSNYVNCRIDYERTPKPLPPLDYKVDEVDYNKVKIKVVKPSTKVNTYVIYINDREHQRISNINDIHTISNLKGNTSYKINIIYINDAGTISEPSVINIITDNPPPPPKLQLDHVKAQNITDSSAELYVAALIPNYDHIYIYDKDDNLIHQQPIAGMVAYRHQLKDLQQDTSYKYFVQVKHGSVLSDKLQIAFKTPRTETEVGNLQGRNEGESVVLSWINPTYNDFKWVKIYRKKEEEPAPKAKFLGFGMMTASAAAGYNPMFKFDGQNWQDLTVEAATTYEYKVTTLDAESNETDGKTVKVKTLPPKIGGSELTGGEDKKNPDGTPELDADGNPIKEDFVIKWSTPTKGKVKVMVGGQEYTTVQASQQQVTIPYSDMQYDGLGNPQVQLIPIADNGTTGQTAQPPPPSGGTIGNVVGSGASAAVNANNLLQISLGLLAKVALFILLGMAFMLVPKLIRIIYYAVTGKDSYGLEEENKKIRVIEKRR